MCNEPRLVDRSEVPYVGIRSQVPIRKFGKVIPESLAALFAWLEQNGVARSGAPFIRFHVINMAAKMDIELGVPVASAQSGDGRITAGVLPAGRYAVLTYKGVKRAIEANAALLKWGAEKGLGWDCWTSDNGDAFGGRFESYLTDPAVEPSQSKWEIEVAIRLADS